MHLFMKKRILIGSFSVFFYLPLQLNLNYNAKRQV